MRPDSRISVRKVPLVVNGQKLGEQNYQYCNDKEECVKAAGLFDGYVKPENLEVV